MEGIASISRKFDGDKLKKDPFQLSWYLLILPRFLFLLPVLDFYDKLRCAC